MATLEYVETITTLSCAECDITFGITKSLERKRRADHGDFYCPMGHRNHWPQKTDLEQAREAATRLQAELDQAEAKLRAERQKTRKAKAETTTMRKRAEATCCPVGDCHRTIAPAQMRRHIASKHPDYAPA